MTREQVGDEVAEVQGLYGPVSIAEVLVQKLWYRQEFRREQLLTRDGCRLRILRPGRWNRLGGPDFLGAEWEIEGRRSVGDVEIHFYQRDWFAHQHHLNPDFNRVGLHVVVFDVDGDERPAETVSGGRPAVLILAPNLAASLEEFAWRDAMRILDGTDPLDLAAPLLRMPVAQRRTRLAEGARRRWAHKVHFARRRLEAEGWEQACHQLVLEVLGYRANRPAMADLAVRHRLDDWHIADDTWIEERLAEGAWRFQGLRPANHPRRRLRQYRALVRHEPQWPQRLAELLSTWEVQGQWTESARPFRVREQLGAWRREVRDAILGGSIPSPRFDTVMVDGILPLVAAEWGTERLGLAWCHWFPGDLSDRLRIFLRVAGLTEAAYPLSNGLQQGAIDLLYSRDHPDIAAAAPGSVEERAV